MIKSLPNKFGITVKLDDKNILEKAKEASQLTVELQDKKDQLKEVCTDLREEIKTLEGNIKTLMNCIQTKSEFIPNADVVEQFDGDKKTVDTMYNGVKVGQRKMTEKEFNDLFNSVFDDAAQ